MQYLSETERISQRSVTQYYPLPYRMKTFLEMSRLCTIRNESLHFQKLLHATRFEAL